MSQPDHKTFLQLRYFSSLDALRFLSIVSVVWHHTAPRWDFLPGSARGFLGVDMFFVISGFLIVTLLLRERDNTSEISLKNFYMRRSLRIFPLYYAILLVVAGMFLFVKPDSEHAPKYFADFPYLMTYTSNWVHLDWVFMGLTWSLATEEQFYLLWPPMEKFLRKFAIPFLLGFLILNQLVNFKLLESPLISLLGEEFRDLEIIQITFTPICLGVLLAHVMHSKKGFDICANIVGSRHATWIFLVILIGIGNIPGDIAGWPRLATHIFMLLLLASVVIRDDHSLVKPFHWKWVRRIGVLCYGIYLFHNIAKYGAEKVIKEAKIQNILEKVGVEKILEMVGVEKIAEMTKILSTNIELILLFILTLVIVIPMSELSFRFFEMPFLKLKSRWTKKEAT